MVKTIQRFFAFCGEENRYKFRASIWLGVLQAIFEALKIPAIACMARALLRGSVETKDILLSLGIMLLSILGSGLIKAKSTMLQTEAGYDTCAKKRVEIAEHILYTKASWQSWKNQDKCLIGKKTDYSAFAHTDMHIWYGIKGTVDKKLSANLEELKAKGYPFTCKIFEDMGHGGLVGENTERFIQEVEAVHRYGRQKEEKA